jgi:nicotinamide mononucleotide transporter
VSPLELVAAVTGAISVWLSVRQNIWSWPTAIVNVVLYAMVFWDAKLYADMGLQVIYALLSIYGWYQWLYGGAGRTELRVTRTPPRAAAVLALIAAAGSALLGTLLRHATDATLPFMDSFLSSTSLVAQWMMTAGLYAVFLVLAVRGYLDWRRSMAVGPPLAAAA